MTQKNREQGRWNPYLAGGAAGVVIVLSAWLTGKYAGASTSFVRSAGMLEKLFNAEHVARLEYFAKAAPIIDWQWMFVAGILIGSFIASTASKTFKPQAVPVMWKNRFGTGIFKRALPAFIGGAGAMYGPALPVADPAATG